MADAKGAAQRFSNTRAAATLPGLHRRREIADILVRQRLGELGLEPGEPGEPRDVRELVGIDGTVLILGQDDDVHDPDDARFMEPDQLVSAFAREVL